ncbi:MAG: hypothetical protein ACRDLN_12705 [Solirubrobacteraceae bacterium]
MAALVSEGDDLVLRLSPWEKLGAVHGDVRVPLGAVEDVAVTRAPFDDLRGIRAPGGAWPRRFALGTWRYRGGKDFVALYRRRPAVIVRLRDAPYRRLIVCADDADATAERIRSLVA